jgi:transposase-like protein
MEQMPGGKRVGRYPDEMRERAVRLVLSPQGEYPSQWKVIESISSQLGINHDVADLGPASGDRRRRPPRAHD